MSESPFAQANLQPQTYAAPDTTGYPQGYPDTPQQTYQPQAATATAPVIGQAPQASNCNPQAAQVTAPDATAVAPLNLYTAVENQDAQNVRLLLRMGANPDMTDEYGRTPLFQAARIGYHGTLQVLLEHDANPNTATVTGMTPLMAAVMNNHLMAAEMLLDEQADASKVDNEGFTALTLAIQDGYTEMVELLLQNGASADQLDPAGFTPLMNAIRSHQVQMAETLITNRVKLNAKDASGEQAIHWATRMGDLRTVMNLLDRGIHVDEPSGSSGWTPLMLAVDQKSPHMMDLLLTRGANTEMRNGDGWTVVMMLAAEPESDVYDDGAVELRPGMLESMATLLQHTPDLTATDDQGHTALMMAAANGNIEMVKQLLQAGADRGAKNAKKQTAQALAKAQGYKEIVKLLTPANPIAGLLQSFSKPKAPKAPKQPKALKTAKGTTPPPMMEGTGAYDEGPGGDNLYGEAEYVPADYEAGYGEPMQEAAPTKKSPLAGLMKGFGKKK